MALTAAAVIHRDRQPDDRQPDDRQPPSGQWSNSRMAITFLAVAAATLLIGAAFSDGRRALALLAGGLFTALVLVGAISGTAWAEGIDAAVSNQIGDHKSHHTTVVTDAIFKFIGDPMGVAIAAAVFGGLLSWRVRSVGPVILVMGAVAAAVAVEHTLKALVGRSLPPDAPADWSVLADYSHTYPSGHVAGSAALLGTIAVIGSAGRALSAKATLAVLVVTTVLSVAGMAPLCPRPPVQRRHRWHASRRSGGHLARLLLHPGGWP